MARATVTNRTKFRVGIPAPINRVLGAYETVEFTLVSRDALEKSVGISDLLDAAIIDINVNGDPTINDSIDTFGDSEAHLDRLDEAILNPGYNFEAVQSLTAVGTVIAPASSFHRVSPTSALVLSATPTINWDAAEEGRVLVLYNAGSFTFTLQRGASFGLQLGAATRAVAAGGSITLLFDGTNFIEQSFTSATSLS